MRWRNTAVYLVILLLVGGYFYYFEVVKKERKEAAEKEAKRVFVFGFDDIKAIEVTPGKEQPVRLEKADQWMLTGPEKSEVDKSTFDAFVGELKSLESSRKMEAPGNLAPYGLDDPPLKIRFLMGERWAELSVGNLNPSGDSRYAMTGGSADVFLINQSAWHSLNKNFKAFRKKELFSWRGDQVVAMEIEWQSGEKVKFERRGDSRDWQASGSSEIKIKPEKMEGLINKVQWLRANDFLEEGARPNPPFVKLRFQFRDGQTAELALAEPDSAANQVVAVSSELPVPVKVPSLFFAEIPRSADAFQDRSLFSREQRDVREVKWKKSGAEGNAVMSDAAKWIINVSSGSKTLDDPWPVNGLLEDLAHSEYTEKGDAGDPAPDANILELLGTDGKLMSIAWTSVAGGEKGDVNVRLEKDGKARNVKVKADDLRNVEEDLEELAKATQAK